MNGYIIGPGSGEPLEPAASAAPEASPEPEPEADPGYVSADRLKVRQSPSADSAEVGRLRQNDEVELLGEEGEWYLIRRGDVSGYVKKEFIAGAPVEN